ncbi:MAG: hypothetical protein ACK5ZG_03705 [Phycisphaerae bacterium]|jgi:hypothetical protein
MILSLIVILGTLLLTFLWSTRGFFSALINLACTIAAGAIAFAFWEPLGYKFLAMAPPRGAMSGLEGAGWGLALMVPFAVSYVVLRAAEMIVIRANVTVSTAANYAGGGVCGLLASIICMGILTLGLSNMRFGREFMGYNAMAWSPNGSVVRQDKMLLPVDDMTAGLYGALSERAFASSEPLAKWHPDFAEVGHSNRMSFGDGRNRNAMRPNEFTVAGRFTVKSPSESINDVTRDPQTGNPQQITMPNGEPYPAQGRIEGFVVNFGSGASETGSGKVSVGSPQIRLVVQNADGTQRETLYPIAVSSQADGTAPIYRRWLYNSEATFIASVGGGAEAYFAFEFAVPKDMDPIALYVRGARAEVNGSLKQLATFSSPAARDAALSNVVAFATGSSGGSAGDIDTSKATVLRFDAQARSVPGVALGSSIGFQIQKGLHSPLELGESDSRREGGRVIGGEKSWTVGEVQDMSGPIEGTLRISQFQVEDDIILVRVDVAFDSNRNAGPLSLGGPLVRDQDRSARVVLVDTNGQTYSAAGIDFTDGEVRTLRMTPGQPLATLSDIDRYARVSDSRPEVQIRLFFRVTRGVTLQHFVVGNTAVATFEPGISTAPQ